MTDLTVNQQTWLKQIKLIDLGGYEEVHRISPSEYLGLVCQRETDNKWLATANGKTWECYTRERAALRVLHESEKFKTVTRLNRGMERYLELIGKAKFEDLTPRQYGQVYWGAAYVVRDECGVDPAELFDWLTAHNYWEQT